MEIAATLGSNTICIGSTFSLVSEQVRVADLIVFGSLVTGFVTVAQAARIVIDIKTAVLECRQIDNKPSGASGKVWEIYELF
jgi:hypothetical protein